MSRIPSTFLSRTSFEISSNNLFFCTINGISVTTRNSFLELDSCKILALNLMEPWPLENASKIPLRPIIVPPVGKSGPGITLIISDSSVNGLSMSMTRELITSDKL